MNMNLRVIILLCAGWVMLPGAYALSSLGIVNDMLRSMDGIRTLKYRFVKEERFKGKMEKKEMLVKYRRQPFAVSLYFYEPDGGMKVLFVDGQNNNQAKIHLNKTLLSWLEPNMDPLSKSMRKGEHHSLMDSGLEFTRKLLTHLRERALAENRFEELCRYEGEVVWDNRKCYKLLLQYPDFKWESYRLKQGESIEGIARQQHLNPYMILEKNKLSWYDKAKAGDEILIPNIYAQKVWLYVDQINHMPVYQEVHDEHGLFERYQYVLLLVNPQLEPEAFDWQ